LSFGSFSVLLLSAWAVTFIKTCDILSGKPEVDESMKKKPDTRAVKKEEDFRIGVFTEDYFIYENLIRKRQIYK